MWQQIDEQRLVDDDVHESPDVGGEEGADPQRLDILFGTAPAPVWIPLPSGPSSCSGRSGSTITRLRSVATACPANDDCANHRFPITSPGGDDALALPSTRRLVRFRSLHSRQYAGAPPRQDGQPPHESKLIRTWSPGPTRVTAVPMFSTIPLPSWPRMIGSMDSPIAGWRASMLVWHMLRPWLTSRRSGLPKIDLVWGWCPGCPGRRGVADGCLPQVALAEWPPCRSGRPGH